MDTTPLKEVDPGLVEAVRAGAEEEEVAVIVRVTDPGALPRGARVITRFGDVATVRIAPTRLSELIDCASVTALEASRSVRPSVDLDDDFDDALPPEGSPYTRRPEGVVGTGARVCVAALDWGVDPAHPAFRRPDGSTRFIALWDQRGPARGEGNRWGYGRIHTTGDIDRALLADDPYAALDYDPADVGGTTGAHGAHVLDIAAGSGAGGGMPGVAPEADLVFVHLARTTDVLGQGNLGDSASLLEALDFVFEVSGGRPTAVNVSVGAHGGPHSGETLVEVGIDNAVALAPGRVVVNSAGNYRRKAAATVGRVAQGQERVVWFDVPAHDTNESELELFYRKIDRMAVEVRGPDERVLARVEPGEDRVVKSGGVEVGRIYHRVHNTAATDYVVDLFLKPDAPPGRWSLLIHGDQINDGRYHAWIERDRGLQPTFAPDQVVESWTTGTLCNGRLSVTAGAIDPHAHVPLLAPFSSAGPTRDGRVKPELVAPGVRIVAARSTPPGQQPAARYTSKSGTSMAAPHVTGALALAFGAARRPLEIAETRALLFASLDRSMLVDRPPQGAELHGLGYGRLDIVAAERIARDWSRREAPDTALGGRADTAVDVHTEEWEPDAFDEDALPMIDYGDSLRPLASDRDRWKVAPPEDAESIGLPAEFLSAQVQIGDLLLRADPTSPLPRVGLVLSQQAAPPEVIAEQGVDVERGGPGLYVSVREDGGGTTRVVGRRLTDGWGRVPRGQRVLRARAPGSPVAEREYVDVPAPGGCYKDIEAPSSVDVMIGFEFDCSLGASNVTPPLHPPGAAWEASVAALEGKNITGHKIASDGFRLEGDGNRIEVATKPVALTSEGRTELDGIIRDVLDLMKDVTAKCRATSPDGTLGYLAHIGPPRYFTIPGLRPDVKAIFPLALKRPPYFQRGCTIAGSPQATFTLPLARIDRFVTVIRRSERFGVAGKALSGPRGFRQGVRSIALYDAQTAVNASRRGHISAGTTLSDGTTVTATNYSPTLQGLLILMVSYLRSGELRYGSSDTEIFAKAYLPLNVKNPFRLLFADLTSAEKRVFDELYDSPRTELWKLAKPTASAADGANRLFPPRVHDHQKGWFASPPTWNEFVEKTVTNTKLIRTEVGPHKKGEAVGCEVLFAPLSRILPHEAGSRRVTVEMRRLGFNWVFHRGFTRGGRTHPGWTEMTRMLFKLAVELNR